MAKVFTITQGLENLGAMKTGGQGSVYKGKRIAEIITAVKLLPTPIYSESDEDKNFRDFKNEVHKLKRVNEKPNPNVVKILSSGLSETGNFPFIEMEYIEGPDLEELLKPPHDPVFTIKEVIKVAEQLSHALAHCHSLDVRHGDIKSNNVKFNIHTGNYVLLDFGLAIMSDEQRRTSLRQAGAVEFMAPEQNEGQMLFQTDVYSFGIILFELLAGSVPFPLKDKGETARNNVRLAHMDTVPPDLISLRKNALPLTWSEDKKQTETHVPAWLITTIYTCLKKKPENRYANGKNLHEFIINNSIQSKNAGEANTIESDVKTFLVEKEHLQQQVLQYRQQVNNKEEEINRLKLLLHNKENNSKYVSEKNIEFAVAPVKKGMSATFFTMLVFLAIGFAVYSAYYLFKPDKSDTPTAGTVKDIADANQPAIKLPEEQAGEKAKSTAAKKKTQTAPAKNTEDSAGLPDAKTPPVKGVNDEKQDDTQQTQLPKAEMPVPTRRQYMVTAKAYIYNLPDENTRRSAFVVPSNNAILNALKDENDFIYVEFVNQLGQSSKGWLRKKDLQLLNE